MPAPADRVVFSTSFEGLLRIAQPLSDDLRGHLQRLGVDPDKLSQSYPLPVYLELLELIRRQLYASIPENEVWACIGRDFIKGYSRTFVGMAIAGASRLLGPGETLKRLTRNIRTANNYTETVATPLATNEYDVWVNYVLRPGFFQGVIEQALLFTGAKNVSVTLGTFEGSSFTYRVRWD